MDSFGSEFAMALAESLILEHTAPRTAPAESKRKVTVLTPCHEDINSRNVMELEKYHADYNNMMCAHKAKDIKSYTVLRTGISISLIRMVMTRPQRYSFNRWTCSGFLMGNRENDRKVFEKVVLEWQLNTLAVGWIPKVHADGLRYSHAGIKVYDPRIRVLTKHECETITHLLKDCNPDNVLVRAYGDLLRLGIAYHSESLADMRLTIKLHSKVAVSISIGSEGETKSDRKVASDRKVELGHMWLQSALTGDGESQRAVKELRAGRTFSTKVYSSRSIMDFARAPFRDDLDANDIRMILSGDYYVDRITGYAPREYLMLLVRGYRLGDSPDNGRLYDAVKFQKELRMYPQLSALYDSSSIPLSYHKYLLDSCKFTHIETFASQHNISTKVATLAADPRNPHELDWSIGTLMAGSVYIVFATHANQDRAGFAMSKYVVAPEFMYVCGNVSGNDNFIVFDWMLSGDRSNIHGSQLNHTTYTSNETLDYKNCVAYGSADSYHMITFDEMDASLAMERNERGLTVLMNPVRVHDFKSRWTQADIHRYIVCLKALGPTQAARCRHAELARQAMVFKPDFVSLLTESEKRDYADILDGVKYAGWLMRGRVSPTSPYPTDSKAIMLKENEDTIDTYLRAAMDSKLEHFQDFMSASKISGLSIVGIHDLKSLIKSVLDRSMCVRVASSRLILTCRDCLGRIGHLGIRMGEPESVPGIE